ncbi:hypothetical protein [Kitasatospora sp. HPMI-4]|uniref:hypothetical protein n=1 Tax=Kitasatospora sp. HPMI-4 TaxID=3448443 RepID=UPI003F199880
MSSHAKLNYRPRLRVLGTVTGVALLLGGGFAAQAVADSGAKPAPAAPKVTTTGDAAPKVVEPGKSGGAPKVVEPGKSGGAPKVVEPGKSGGAPKVVEPGKSGGAPKVVEPGKSGSGAAPAENAPRVIQPGSGVQK